MMAKALSRLYYAVSARVDGAPDHPWIPGGNFADGEIVAALTEAKEALAACGDDAIFTVPEANELLQWAHDASMGDNGEKPTVEFEFDGRWFISARSFYDGSADCELRQNKLQPACIEVLDRLRQHPQRQHDADLRAAALRAATATGRSSDEMLEVLQGLDRKVVR